jgi:sulfite reductase beta subunit-like hemoprotein
VRVPSARAAQALEGLFHDYMKERLDDGESFRAWVERVGDARAKAALGR